MVLLEAQSFGLPVVAFDCDTGPSDIIENNNNGYLCSPENIEELADKLIAIMSLDLREYLKMSDASKKIVKDKFLLSSVLNQWNKLLE